MNDELLENMLIEIIDKRILKENLDSSVKKGNYSISRTILQQRVSIHDDVTTLDGCTRIPCRKTSDKYYLVEIYLNGDIKNHRRIIIFLKEIEDLKIEKRDEKINKILSSAPQNNKII